MPQGVLPFKYEAEKQQSGLTALGGLPAYLDLAHMAGLRKTAEEYLGTVCPHHHPAETGTQRPPDGHGQRLLKTAVSAADLLRRPEMDLAAVARLAGLTLPRPKEEVTREVELAIKCQGYIERQGEQVERFKRLESVRLPDDLPYAALAGLSREAVEKLALVQPRTLGLAARISGITPAAVSILQVYLKKEKLI